ncbi:MAG: inorganic phosphate transporter [Chloroherpetonaceae bacterium]
MDIQLIILIFLGILGIIDLSVGVSNDAVNFTNSAIGSKAGSFRIVMICAGLGIFVGTLFSGGMMEIARSGIFNPAFFTFPEVMIIFFAAMAADVILLDFFNTYGLPTSTTVSIVMDLLGAALGVSVFKIVQNAVPFGEIVNYLNIGKIVAILSSIVLSIAFAFIFTFLFQYISRLLFSFDFKKRFKQYGSIWGGFSITIISYFIFLKGLQYAPFITADTYNYIQDNINVVLLGLFLFSTIILQLLHWFTKINTLQIIVLYGTFSLAMSFAANDLVNFLGVPLGGLEAYRIAHQTGDPLNTNMLALASTAIKSPTFILVIAGVIMFITLLISKKARTVTKTEINLGRQEEGFERFEPFGLARTIVSASISFANFMKRITPNKILVIVQRQFDVSKFHPKTDDKGEHSYFDLIRAASILTVSTALIAFGTSLKLPLSTTYITFIAAMAAALPDKAWGRESAVYRVSGVIAVIGGWLLTGVLAAAFAFVVACLILLLGNIGIFVVMIFVAFLFWHSSNLHKKREKEQEILQQKYNLSTNKESDETYIELMKQITMYVASIYGVLNQCINNLATNNAIKLRKNRKELKEIANKVSIFSSNLLNLLENSQDTLVDFSNSTTKVISALQNLTDKVQVASEQYYYYVANSHTQLLESQIKELTLITQSLNEIQKGLLNSAEQPVKFRELNLTERIDSLHALIETYTDHHLQRIKEVPKPVKRNLLYFNILSDLDDVTDTTKTLYKNLRKVFKRILPEDILIEPDDKNSRE